MELTNPHESFEFTPEQLQLLRATGGKPLHVPVKETNKVYLVVEEGAISTLDEDYIRQGLAHAAAQIERGEVADWDIDEIRAACRATLSKPE
jgi:hypothetical protein